MRWCTAEGDKERKKGNMGKCSMVGANALWSESHVGLGHFAGAEVLREQMGEEPENFELLGLKCSK